jgi:hypothetical protein
VTNATGVRGEITVTNTGCNDTKDLTIWDTVQMMPCDGAFTDYVTFKVDTTCHPVLAAGESYAYAYEVEFAPVEGAQYRNVANVTISNFVDHAGECFGVQACEEFCLPDVPTVTYLDEEACLRDDFSVPTGFVVEALTDVGPWELECVDGATHWEFIVNLKITNVDAPRNMTYVLCNQAILVPEDSGVEASYHVPVTIFSGPIETTLCVEKTAEASWTEDIELGMALPDGWTANNVNAGSAESIAEVLPVEIAQYVIHDIGTYNVWGSIKVTNTGDCPTEGLRITDTIQMWNGECWVDVATIDVDVSCMPVLAPGESFCYPYAVTFTLEDVSSLLLGSCDFRNVAYAEICNYDDDAGVMGMYVYLPLDVPMAPATLTMKTTASYSFDEVKPLDHTGLDSQLAFETDVCYEQMVIVHYGDERVTVDTWTNITAHTKVTHSCWHESVCKDLDTAIYHAESAVIVGNDNKATVTFESTAYDNETLTICVLCYPVELNLCAVLYTNNNLGVLSNYNGYMFDNQQLVFYGVFASFEWPEEAYPDFMNEA